MEVLYACCCGIEVHAKMLVACVLKQGKKEVRTFSTMTEDLLRLLAWLTQAGCTHVAMESTGECIGDRSLTFWKEPWT
jgi:hypothetical protein